MSLQEAAQQVLDCARWVNDEQAIVPYERMINLRIMLENVVQAEPVAWMVYTLDGQSAFVTDNPADFTPEHRALPLYTAPPKREPLTEEELVGMTCECIEDGTFDMRCALDLARAIERAHGIGGEE